MRVPQRRAGSAPLAGLLLVVCIASAGFVGEVDLAKLFWNIGKFASYIGRLFFLDTGDSVFTNPYEWFWGITQKNKWLPLLGQSLMIAYLGTAIGALGAFCWSFGAAGNLVATPWIRLGAHRFREFCRTVPELVFAVIFVIAFGLGPFPGVLALAIHDRSIGQIIFRGC